MRRSRFSAATALVAAFLLSAAPAVAADDPLIIEGSGFGHGVGMSQYGAYGRALDGQTYDQILGAYYQGTTVGTIGAGGIPALDDVMVSVASDDPDVEITIEDGPGSGGSATTLTRIGGSGETVDLLPGDTVTIVDESPKANGGCVVTVATAAGDAEWETGPCDFTVDLASSDAPPDNLVTLDDCRTSNCTFGWGEVLHIVDNGSSQRITPDKTCSGGLCPGFDLVVQASLDDYTLGIAEVPFSWGDSAKGKHALYTQAVAARSYAASFTTSRNHAVWGCFCDLVNSSSAQVYAGWIGNRAKWQNWDAAARFTAGEVVAHPNGYDGIIRAFYSSANGGASENNEDMWGGSPISWLRSVDDPWTTSASSGNPNRSWAKSTTTAILESRLALDSVNEVRIAETFDSGTPSRIVVVGQRNGQTVEVDTYAGSPLDGKLFDAWFGLLGPHIDGFSGDLPAPPPLTDTARWAGADRYETAVEISKANHPTGSDAVIIATGLNHPDALASASLAAAIDAPILLVAGGTVPASTLAEVNRLAPSKIYILGGTAAVPQSAENVLDDVAPVTRLAGANRYATAIEISKATHSGPVDTVFVAPGTSFVEALVTGPVAASNGDAILLVPPTSLPGSVASELARLDPSKIVVVGGGTVVSSGVVAALGGYANEVVSIAGANRYATSVEVAQYGFPGGADTVLVATGAIFPDALAGAGVGGDLASPILLVEPANLPGVVATELGRLDPLTVRVLGGPAAVSDAVVADMVDLLD